MLAPFPFPFLFLFQMLSFPVIVSLGLSLLLAVGLCALNYRVVSASRTCPPSPTGPALPMMLVRPVPQAEIPRTASGDVDLVALGLQEPDVAVPPATAPSPSTTAPPPASPPSNVRDRSGFVPGIIRGSSPVYRPTVVEPTAARPVVTKKPLRALLSFKSRVLRHHNMRSSSGSEPLPAGPEMSPDPPTDRPVASNRASLDRGTQCSLAAARDHRGPDVGRSGSSSPVGRRAGFAAAEVHYFSERGLTEEALSERNALASIQT